MRTRITTAVLLLFTLCFIMPAQGKILKSIDMETPETSGKMGSDDSRIADNGRWYRSSEQVRSGSRSLKCVVKARSDVKQRCEEHTMDLEENVEYWIGMSVYIPSNLKMNSGYLILSQLYFQSKCSSPAISFCIEDNNTVYTNHSRFPSCDNAKTNYYRNFKPITKGQWTDLVINLIGSSTGEGKFKCWLNGVLIEDYTGTTIKRGIGTGEPNLGKGETRIGVYMGADPNKTEQVFYYDDYKLGDANSSYEEVAPGGGSTIVSTPSISPNGGAIFGPTEISLSSLTSGAEIRYTLTGNDPTTSSTLYSAPFIIEQATTVKAQAFKAEMDPSGVASATFTLEQLPDWQIPVTGVTASSNDGNVPENSIDNNLTTRWSADGDGEWIQYDFGTTTRIEQMSIAFYLGDQRSSSFDLQVSDDGSTWTTVGSFESSGATLDPEWFVIAQDARYVRYVGHGNSSNTWNSLNEVAFSNIPSTALTPIAYRSVNGNMAGADRVMYDLRGRRISHQRVNKDLSGTPGVRIIRAGSKTYRTILEME